MSLETIPLPSGVRRIAEMLMDAVRRGMERCARDDAGANADTGARLSLLNQITRLLRWAFIIAATWIDLPAAKPRTPRRIPRPQRVRLARPAFRLFPRYRVTYDGSAAHPNPFARAERDPVLIAQRKLDALTRAFADPLPCIRRVARRLPTQLMVIGWRPPRRPPPTWRRHCWAEQIEGWREAWFQLRAWRRRMRDMSEGAPA
jgi:hypothetical protein